MYLRFTFLIVFFKYKSVLVNKYVHFIIMYSIIINLSIIRQRRCHPHSRSVRGVGEERGKGTARLATTPDRIRSCASRVRLPSAGRRSAGGGKGEHRKIAGHNQEGHRSSLLEQGDTKRHSRRRSARRLYFVQ